MASDGSSQVPQRPTIPLTAPYLLGSKTPASERLKSLEFSITNIAERRRRSLGSINLSLSRGMARRRGCLLIGAPASLA